MWKFLIPVVLFGLLVVVFFRGLQLDPTVVPSPLIGKSVPAFELPALKNPAQRISNKSLPGKVHLLNVWATWCVGCREEHDTLLAIRNSGLVPIIGWNYRDDRNAAVEWLGQLGDPYLMSVFDGDGRGAIDWGVYGAPETFVIDQHGIIRYKHLGPISIEVWQDKIAPIVQKLNAE